MTILCDLQLRLEALNQVMELLSTGVSTDTPSCKQPPTSDVTSSENC